MGARDFRQGNEKLFVSGFLRGFRMWNYLADPHAGWLQSTAYPDHLWQAGRNDAVCMNGIAAKQRAAQQVKSPCPCVACQDPGNWRKYQERLKQTLEAFEAHETPSRDDAACNTCGFYGFHKPEMLDVDTRYVQRTSKQIGGSFKATGSIVLATLGFRAQHAEVEALYGGLNGEGERAAEHYGVPWFQTQAELVEQFPFIPLEGHEYEAPPPPETSAGKYIVSTGSGGIYAYWQGNGMPPRWVSSGNVAWSLLDDDT
jgi:hypothetical protein